MPELKPFKWRHYQAEIILLFVRWYLRHSLSYRDLEEMMAERGLKLDHSTIARWVLAYAPELEKRVKPQLKLTGDSRQVDETYIKVKGRTMIRIAQEEITTSLPVAELKTSAEGFLEPMLRDLPDKRLRVVGVLIVLGILAGQSPLITQMARGVREGSQYVLDMARRMYRFIWNGRLSARSYKSGCTALGNRQ